MKKKKYKIFKDLAIGEGFKAFVPFLGEKNFVKASETTALINGLAFTFDIDDMVEAEDNEQKKLVVTGSS